MSNYPETDLYTIASIWKPKKSGSKILGSLVFDENAEEAITAAREVGGRGILIRNKNKKKETHPDYNVCASVPKGWEPEGSENNDDPFADDNQVPPGDDDAGDNPFGEDD